MNATFSSKSSSAPPLELQLIKACIEGDTKIVKQVLSSYPSSLQQQKEDLVNTRGAEGWFLLALASYYNHSEITLLLLENGADLWQCLEEEIPLLLTHSPSASLNSSRNNNNSSNGHDLASFQDHHRREEPRRVTIQRSNALHIAAAGGNTEVCKVLLEYCHQHVIEDETDIENNDENNNKFNIFKSFVESEREDGDYATPLLQAVRYNHTECAEVLIRIGNANVNARMLVDAANREKLLAQQTKNKSHHHQSLGVSKLCTTYPILLAVENLNLEMVKLLLQPQKEEEIEADEEVVEDQKNRRIRQTETKRNPKCNVNAQRTSDGNTALHVAVSMFSKSEEKTKKSSRNNNNNKRGIDVNDDDESFEDESATAETTRNINHTNNTKNDSKIVTMIIRLLLSHGADVNIRNFEGKLAFDLVKENGDAIEAMKRVIISAENLLITAGAVGSGTKNEPQHEQEDEEEAMNNKNSNNNRTPQKRFRIAVGKRRSTSPDEFQTDFDDDDEDGDNDVSSITSGEDLEENEEKRDRANRAKKNKALLLVEKQLEESQRQTRQTENVVSELSASLRILRDQVSILSREREVYLSGMMMTPKNHQTKMLQQQQQHSSFSSVQDDSHTTPTHEAEIEYRKQQTQLLVELTRELTSQREARTRLEDEVQSLRAETQSLRNSMSPSPNNLSRGESIWHSASQHNFVLAPPVQHQQNSPTRLQQQQQQWQQQQQHQQQQDNSLLNPFSSGNNTTNRNSPTQLQISHAETTIREDDDDDDDDGDENDRFQPTTESGQNGETSTPPGTATISTQALVATTTAQKQDRDALSSTIIDRTSSTINDVNATNLLILQAQQQQQLLLQQSLERQTQMMATLMWAIPLSAAGLTIAVMMLVWKKK